MAKKKTTTVTEEVSDEFNYQRDHDKSLEEIAAEKVAGKKDEPEPSKEETKVDEAPKKEEPPVEEKKVEFDPEELKKQAAEEAANKILERLTGTKEKKNETDQELVSPWSKEGRNPKDYEEIADWAVAKKQLLDDRRAKEIETKTTAERDLAAKGEKEREESFLKFVDQESKELTDEGFLPKIRNEKDPKDLGVLAMNNLLQTMATVNNERVSKGLPIIYSINKIYHHYYKAGNAQPAGANAPVSGTRGQRGTDADESRFIYARDHKKTFTQLAGK